jgi:GNAT superfamily N-acetyltransferase
MDEITIRRATVDDLDAILAHLRAGFASFAEFAPAGWQPPNPHRERTAKLLERPSTWAAIALDGEHSVGHVSFTPGRGRPFEQHGGAWRDEPPIPGLAHLWQLFVIPERWGTGVAERLYEAGIDAMVGEGYERARLYTPVDHGRARRFYERRGWTMTGQAVDSEIGLALAEYRLELSRRESPS